MRISAEIRSTIPVFAALGDETRFGLVVRLTEGESLSIAELTAGTQMSRQAVTRHLHVLADAGVVRGNRTGREQMWELKAERVRRAQAALDRIGREWEEALQRLKTLVEDVTEG